MEDTTRILSYSSFFMGNGLQIINIVGVVRIGKILQNELAKAIGAYAPVIGRYERSEVKPSVEVAAKMAEALGVSLDYLVGFADYELDNAITQKILDIQTLNDEDKTSVLKTIDALLRDVKARKAYAR